MTEFDRELRRLGMRIRDDATTYLEDVKRGDEYNPQVVALLADAKTERLDGDLLGSIGTEARARDVACDVVIDRWLDRA